MRRKTRLRHTRLSIETIESRICLTAITFVAQGAPLFYATSSLNVDPFRASPATMSISDLDGDGDDDLLFAMNACLDGCFVNEISWYENLGGRFGNQRIIDSGDSSRSTVYLSTADIDGDGDLDVIAGNYRTDGISWYENSDGRGNFDKYHHIEDNRTFFSIGDLDEDGDLDIVAGSSVDTGHTSDVAWYENVDGAGTFTLGQIIAHDDAAGSLPTVWTVDVDGDDDLDVITQCFSCEDRRGIAWSENLSIGSFSSAVTISTEEFEQIVYAGDLNGDHFVDVLTANEERIVWYAYDPRQITAWHRQVIGGGADRGFNDLPHVIVADFDQDGDVDIVKFEPSFFGEMTIHWFENEAGTFSLPRTILSESTFSLQRAVAAADIDGNGLPDVAYVLGDGAVMWLQSRLIGDSNNDGVFDTGDLVAVFAKGYYESPFRIPRFDDGDWNQDGKFDTRDLVYALQSGNYADVTATEVVARGQIDAAGADWLFVASAVDAVFKRSMAAEFKRHTRPFIS
ncbi:MAG: VCBS repeat-containing protein [Planctomycetales bacterium]|nr:VCBS repeat-containing protein [Planctomycetales bacterium]